MRWFRAWRDRGHPRKIGDFKIIRLLGAGGMGEVYLGVDGGQYAAVKLIRPGADAQRFEREIEISHRVPPGVSPRVLASANTRRRRYLAVEYVPGVTLEQAVQESGALPSGALWLLLSLTAGRLRQIHKSNIVHRDLKPANVMLTASNVKLIDFGVALDGDRERLTRDGAGCGTPGYQAPEQRHGGGPVTCSADVYALGAMLTYAASRNDPSLNSKPDVGPLHKADEALAEVIERCLAEEPGARPSADDLVMAGRSRERAGDRCWPQEVTSQIKERAALIEKSETVPPESGGPVRRLRSVMLAVGVRAGIASAIVAGGVYGVAAVLESGLGAGLRAGLVNGAVNGVGAGLTFGLLYGFAAPFRTDAQRPVRHARRRPAVSALLVMIPVGMVIGVGYGLMLGSVPGLAAGLMAAVGTGTTVKVWGR